MYTFSSNLKWNNVICMVIKCDCINKNSCVFYTKTLSVHRHHEYGRNGDDNLEATNDDIAANNVNVSDDDNDDNAKYDPSRFGVVITVLVTEHKGRGFKPGRGDGLLREITIISTPSFGWEVKPEVPYRKILRHVKDHLRYFRY
jgi:hypothetical protein